MWEIVLLCYGVMAVTLALTCFVIGLLCKDFADKVLWGKIKFGVVNSVLIGVFWPLFAMAIVCGYCYDAIAFLRKL